MLNVSTLHERPAELLQALLRFDTTNPPGGEAECIYYIADLLALAEIEHFIVAREQSRPNVVARLPGRGEAPPLLLYGHVDVVTTANQEWTHGPFSGDIADNCVWGRGALDMKGGVAMMLAALLRLRARGEAPPGDVIFAAVCDEEYSGYYGAQYLVEEHARLFADVRYALGEFGGFTTYIGGRTFYPIMVGEKQSCQMRATVRGPGGHGSLTMHGGTTARLGRLLTTLDRHGLPAHVTPVARMMIEGIAAQLRPRQRVVIQRMLNPRFTDRVLRVMGEAGTLLTPLLHNTVNATIIQGGNQVNVIPSRVDVHLDGRLLPGFGPEDALRELQALVGPGVEIAVLSFEAGPPDTPNMGLYDTLADILREGHPGGVPIPYLMSGVTDGRFFTRLGIQTYGFLPMKLPPGWNFAELIHAADERIPIAALEFGSEAMYQATRRFHE